MVFNVCPDCGVYGVERQVEAMGEECAAAVCDECGARIPFRRRGLHIVTGASGAGKTASCREMIDHGSGFTVLESDILWGAVPADGDQGVAFYWNTWLRMIKNLHQSGSHVVLCGTLDPRVLESLPERRYIGQIQCLGLTIEPEAHIERLRKRPTWRESGNEAFVSRHIAFNQWLIDNAGTCEPGWTLHDTTTESVALTADAIFAWARQE